MTNVLTKIRERRMAFIREHEKEPNRITIPRLIEDSLLALTPAEVGDTLAGNIVEKGRDAFGQLYGMRVDWDAEALTVKYEEPYCASI